VARWTAPAGPAAQAAAGALAIAAVFAVLARPLRLTELDALLSGAAARLRRALPTRR
jgi:putative peptidoglycan lipid II flippase